MRGATGNSAEPSTDQVLDKWPGNQEGGAGGARDGGGAAGAGAGSISLTSPKRL